jgi:hypothetical protein
VLSIAIGEEGASGKVLGESLKKNFCLPWKNISKAHFLREEIEEIQLLREGMKNG